MIQIKVLCQAEVKWAEIVKEDLAMAFDAICPAKVVLIEPLTSDNFCITLTLDVPETREQDVKKTVTAYLRRWRDFRLVSIKADRMEQLNVSGFQN